MTRLLIYWCIGCVVVGPAMGARISECPNEKNDFIQMAAAVAIWPAVIVAAIVLKPGLPKNGCEASSSSALSSNNSK